MKTPARSPAVSAKGAARGKEPVRTGVHKEFERELTSLFVGAAEILGLPKSVASIYGTIFASPRPLSFADIEERLAISKGSVSQGIRILRAIGVIDAVAADDDRREYFAPQMEIRRLLLHMIQDRIEPQLTNVTLSLSKLSDGLSSFEATDAQEMRRRLRYLQSWDRKARMALPILKAILKRGNSGGFFSSP